MGLQEFIRRFVALFEKPCSCSLSVPVSGGEEGVFSLDDLGGTPHEHWPPHLRWPGWHNDYFHGSVSFHLLQHLENYTERREGIKP